MVDRGPAALQVACAPRVPAALALAGRTDILHANAGLHVGGELVEAMTIRDWVMMPANFDLSPSVQV
jgi:NADP-dependent 3-hydroxy acid dehydrogenase YdfG